MTMSCMGAAPACCDQRMMHLLQGVRNDLSPVAALAAMPPAQRNTGVSGQATGQRQGRSCPLWAHWATWRLVLAMSALMPAAGLI